MIDSFVLCSNLDDCLRRLDGDGHLAVATSKQHAAMNSAMPDWKMHCFADSQHLHSHPVALFVRQNHPLRSRIDNYVQRLVEGGLLVKWKRDIQLHSPHIVVSGRNRKEKLTNEHIFLGWVLFGAFLLFTVLAFAAEHIIAHQMERANAGRFWHLAEKFIDGRRYLLVPKRKIPIRKYMDRLQWHRRRL